MKPSDKKTPGPAPERRPWETPAARPVGTVSQILEGGGGKASILASDSGDVHKPYGQS
jgi:hypothetical protein